MSVKTKVTVPWGSSAIHDNYCALEVNGEGSARQPPPFAIEAFAGRTRNDLLFWIESVRAVVAGDSLAD
jgi:hypothetical protein